MAINKKTPKAKPSSEYPDIKDYPPQDDIYSRAKEEEDIDPEHPSRHKAPNTDPDAPNELNFSDDMTAEDLDIPGNEDDESPRANGNEDEENNYYSMPKN
jgi:hypothetical protein